VAGCCEYGYAPACYGPTELVYNVRRLSYGLAEGFSQYSNVRTGFIAVWDFLGG
jgi:hypothetical protein